MWLEESPRKAKPQTELPWKVCLRLSPPLRGAEPGEMEEEEGPRTFSRFSRVSAVRAELSRSEEKELRLVKEESEKQPQPGLPPPETLGWEVQDEFQL